ncbi:MAG: ATP-dependent 6-phosphofructokinase [Pirellulales bacterium]|nr:ATP-dependent 6-phosphofructokinase [Pirellulales bacterium]
MSEEPSFQQRQFEVSTLGACQYDSPLQRPLRNGKNAKKFIPDDARVLYEPRFRLRDKINTLSFERAGAREKVFFDPRQMTAAIVTCGGLCPGINNIIRSVVLELSHNCGVQKVLGIRYGYQGLQYKTAHPPLALTIASVEGIHHQGGTILGSSRGRKDPKLAVDFMTRSKIDVLFCIGGDGTQRGAHQIAQEVARRKIPIAVVGIPKTIDNDIKFCYRSFGYYSAVAEAEKVIDRAHVEAKGVENGVGLVKLMGREAGFIAAAAALASGEANFVLVPEVPFDLDGSGGLLEAVDRRLRARGHAVVVVAEGAGQHLLDYGEEACDVSGNPQLGDIGLFLKQELIDSFEARKMRASVKYFDPSYHIRSVPANAADSLLCERLARSAVHAALAGKTDLLIGLWHNNLIHVPLKVSTGVKKRLSPAGELWNSVLALTGQEKWFRA